jgi:hypothetical protein
MARARRCSVSQARAYHRPEADGDGERVEDVEASDEVEVDEGVVRPGGGWGPRSPTALVGSGTGT